MLTLAEKLQEVGRNCSAPLTVTGGGKMMFETVIAERKSLLARKKLSYRCVLRMDDQVRKVRFFERLKESGFGLSGVGDGLGPGFSVKKESYSVSGKERSGSIEAQGKLFGEKYGFTFDYSRVREEFKRITEEAGYAFEVCLLEKSL